jgi:hypothetical protein
MPGVKFLRLSLVNNVILPVESIFNFFHFRKGFYSFKKGGDKVVMIRK